MDVSGTKLFLFPRITGTYQELSGGLLDLSRQCEALVAYEHPADEDVASTHVHFLMIKPHIGVEGLKKRLKKLGIQRDRNGWMWETTKTHPTWEGALVYMTKGRLEPVFLSGFDKAECEVARKKWVDHTPAEGRGKEKALVKAFMDSHDHKWEPNLDQCRKWVFHYLWTQDKRVPNPSFYKTMSGTCYLTWAEKHNNIRPFSIASDEVFNLWY